MKKLLGFLMLSVTTLIAQSPVVDNFERRIISRGDNRPDFNVSGQEGYTQLIVALHLGVAPEDFQKSARWSPSDFTERIEFLREKNFVHQRQGRWLPSCMVITDQQGAELYRHAEPLARAIADAVAANLDTVRTQYGRTELSRTIGFETASFLILSNVLLDNWQIFNVERDFLGSERPLRHGKRYYLSFQENLRRPREAFGLYGNGYVNNCAVYGNNRNTIDQERLQERLGTIPVVSPADSELFNQMAGTFTPSLVGLLKRERPYIDKVFRVTGYADEVTFEEFFIWWYHFIYTKATDILAERGLLSIPVDGNFFYRQP